MSPVPVSCRCVIAIAILVLLTADPAAAQDDRRVSLGVAAGLARPFHGDFDFTPIAWQTDVRVDAARHFGFTVFFEEWRHTDEDVMTDQPITGPGGLLGRAERITVRTAHRTRAAGWSLLGLGTTGRLTLAGGGGISYLRYSRDFSQMMTGCTPASICRDFTSTFADGRFAAQVQGGADVAVTAHLGLMAQFRLVVPAQEPGSGHGTALTGARLAF